MLYPLSYGGAAVTIPQPHPRAGEESPAAGLSRPGARSAGTRGPSPGRVTPKNLLTRIYV